MFTCHARACHWSPITFTTIFRTHSPFVSKSCIHLICCYIVSGASCRSCSLLTRLRCTDQPLWREASADRSQQVTKMEAGLLTVGYWPLWQSGYRSRLVFMRCTINSWLGTEVIPMMKPLFIPDWFTTLQASSYLALEFIHRANKWGNMIH